VQSKIKEGKGKHRKEWLYLTFSTQASLYSTR